MDCWDKFMKDCDIEAARSSLCFVPTLQTMILSPMWGVDHREGFDGVFAYYTILCNGAIKLGSSRVQRVDGPYLWPIIHISNICNILFHAYQDVRIKYGFSLYNC